MDFSVKTLVAGMVGTNCYILKDNSTDEGMVIDPGDNAKGILAYIEEAGIDVKLVALTHGHFDHIGAVDELREKLKVPVAIHKDDADMLTDGKKNLSAFTGGGLVEGKPADILLNDGDNISFGKCTLRVISTPGHTKGGICLYGGGALFSGDTLFAGSIGRTDFPGGSLQELVEAIKNRLNIVADAAKVFPGHGPATNMGIERECNPYM